MNNHPVPPGPVLLITGGSGFVGQAILRELLLPNPVVNPSEIRIFDVNQSPDLPEDPRIRFIFGDVRNADDIQAAASGIDAVIHLAAMVDWGTHPPGTVYGINVDGTRNALKAARNAGAKVFVYTSSLDAVISGETLVDVDEDIPYPEKPQNAYCGSKAEAEKIVAASDFGSGGFRTVIIRPSSVWGEGDPYHISALINLSLRGPYVRIGDGRSVQQLVYVGNLAHGHLLACRELLEKASSGADCPCAGKPYFITDGPPENFFKFFDRVVEGSGYTIRPVNLWIPRGVMMVLGTLAELGAWLLRPLVRINPKLSRFAVRYICNDFTYDSSRAELDFGFLPRYDREEAMENTCTWFREKGPVGIPLISEGPRQPAGAAVDISRRIPDTLENRG